MPEPTPSEERSELQVTARDLGRWQGATEQQIQENIRRLGGIDEAVKQIDTNVSDMKVDLATLKTKVTLWSAIGGLVGAGIISFAVNIGLS